MMRLWLLLLRRRSPASGEWLQNRLFLLKPEPRRHFLCRTQVLGLDRGTPPRKYLPRRPPRTAPRTCRERRPPGRARPPGTRRRSERPSGRALPPPRRPAAGRPPGADAASAARAPQLKNNLGGQGPHSTMMRRFGAPPSRPHPLVPTRTLHPLPPPPPSSLLLAPPEAPSPPAAPAASATEVTPTSRGSSPTSSLLIFFNNAPSSINCQHFFNVWNEKMSEAAIPQSVFDCGLGSSKAAGNYPPTSDVEENKFVSDLTALGAGNQGLKDCASKWANTTTREEFTGEDAPGAMVVTFCRPEVPSPPPPAPPHLRSLPASSRPRLFPPPRPPAPTSSAPASGPPRLPSTVASRAQAEVLGPALAAAELAGGPCSRAEAESAPRVELQNQIPRHF